MKRGKVCAIHNEFASDGVCRWCQPPPPEAITYLDVPIQPADAAQQPGVAGGGLGWTWMPPPPILNCTHDGALYDFGSVVSCAACGKILHPQPASP